MLRVIIFISFISQAYFEMQTFQHQMYVSRKSRSNSSPINTGYVYSRVGKGPGLMTTFGNSYVKSTEKYTAIKTDEDYIPKNVTSIPNEIECGMLENTFNDNTSGTGVPSKQNEEHVKAKTKCLKGAELQEESLKTAGHYVPIPAMKEIFSTYDKQYRIDGEDVRTGSKNTYIGWPYTYQINNVNTNDKVKDKHFLGAGTSVIPVHEYPDDIPDNPSPPVRRLTNSAYYVRTTTDNPIYGNQPFFSFVLNDYFDKNNEEDPLIFKDFTWGEEFDHGLPYQDHYDNGRPSRHLDYKYPKQRQEGEKYFDLDYKRKAGDQESVMRNHDSNRDYAKYVKDDEKKANQLSEHGIKTHRQSGFKDFLDSFANKFGSEKENKNSKFMLKQNQDKGEKRKGFRRVYHKDEYQEDNEFYDNTNKKAQAEESGGSNTNIGGSQAVVQTHAAASVGDEANAQLRRGETEKKSFEKNIMGHDRDRLRDEKINHYRNIARNAALSNNADYIDQ